MVFTFPNHTNSIQAIDRVVGGISMAGVCKWRIPFYPPWSLLPPLLPLSLSPALFLFLTNKYLCSVFFANPYHIISTQATDRVVGGKCMAGVCK